MNNKNITFIISFSYSVITDSNGATIINMGENEKGD